RGGGGGEGGGPALFVQGGQAAEPLEVGGHGDVLAERLGGVLDGGAPQVGWHDRGGGCQHLTRQTLGPQAQALLVQLGDGLGEFAGAGGVDGVGVGFDDRAQGFGHQPLGDQGAEPVGVVGEVLLLLIGSGGAVGGFTGAAAAAGAAAGASASPAGTDHGRSVLGAARVAGYGADGAAALGGGFGFQLGHQGGQFRLGLDEVVVVVVSGAEILLRVGDLGQGLGVLLLGGGEVVF